MFKKVEPSGLMRVLEARLPSSVALCMQLQNSWHSIVGSALSSKSIPLKLVKYGKNMTMYLGVQGVHSVLMSQYTEDILARISEHIGIKLCGIKIVRITEQAMNNRVGCTEQARVISGPVQKEPDPDALNRLQEDVASIEKMLEHVDPAFKGRLLSLALAIKRCKNLPSSTVENLPDRTVVPGGVVDVCVKVSD